jgi:uncharacterized protein (TIGR00725 family)
MRGSSNGDAAPVLAVLGPSAASVEEMQVAERVGGMAARAGWVVLTGGGPGVMEAASRGAVEVGGLTVGILPTSRSTENYPNPWVRVSIFTGVGSARNAFNVLSATLCVAIGGGPGTLSEIALALKHGKDIWCWRSWAIQPPPGAAPTALRVFDDPEALSRALAERFA